MAAGPITFLEIEAYRRQTFADLTAFEVGLIRRIDIAALTVMSGQQASKKPDPEAPPQEIPATDVKSVKGFFRGLGAKIKPK